MHPAVTRLRGRAEPREDILDRLLRINPKYRIAWVPPGKKIGDHQRPALWRIYEYNPHALRRAAAQARWARFDKMSEQEQGKNPGRIYEIEAAIDGLNFVAEYTEDQFGTDRMFQNLEQSERELAALRDDVARAQREQAEQEVEDEMKVNSDFADFVGEVAKEFYHRVVGNPFVPVSGPKEKS